MNAIEIKSLTKKYKDIVAVNDLSLNIAEGELFGLLGINGAGKTTLIKILSGLTKKTSGSIYINGFNLDSKLSEIKKIIDISPQESSVALNLTVRENIDFFANLYGKKNTQIIEDVIKTFRLDEVLNKKAKLLSGGWKRRLSIAVALISEPKILFLDEPTLGLDVIARRELWNILSELKGEITIILTSHYLEEIEHLCDRVAILSEGKLLQVGTVTEIKQNTNSNTFEEAFTRIVGGYSNE